jgi:hypothetical protein
MGIRDVALQIKHWAQNQRMMGGYAVQPPVDNTVIYNVFKSVGLASVTKSLQARGVSYVGINEETQTIVIFTERKLTRKDEKLFENLTAHLGNKESYHIAVVHSGIAQVGGPPQPPPGIPPYHEHGGRYTCGSSIYMGSEKGAGTLGCLVRDKAGVMYGLSNNHVTGGANYAAPGLPIVAPGSVDVASGGRDPETIGHHHSSYPFVDGFPEIVDADGNLDAAIFKITDEDRVSSKQRQFYDTPATFMPLAVGTRFLTEVTPDR